MELSKWSKSKEEFRMLKLKAIMRGKNTTDYIKGLVENDRPEPATTKAHCFQCNEEHALVPTIVTESVIITIWDHQKEIKVTDFPAQACSKCGNTTISVGLAAEVENIVDEIVGERINRTKDRTLPEKISFNSLQNMPQKAHSLLVRL